MTYTTEIEIDPVKQAFERCVNLLCHLDMEYTFTTEEFDEFLEALHHAEEVSTGLSKEHLCQI